MPTKISTHIEALSKISRAITSDLYLEDILKLIVTVTAEVTGSKICSLMLLDEKKFGHLFHNLKEKMKKAKEERDKKKANKKLKKYKKKQG